ncbi:MAG: hypothetical protein ACYSW3_00380 [Planctomycetota bacterium]
MIEKLFRKGFTLVEEPGRTLFRHTGKVDTVIEITDETGKALPETFNEPIRVTIYWRKEKLLDAQIGNLKSFLEWGDEP